MHIQLQFCPSSSLNMSLKRYHTIPHQKELMCCSRLITKILQQKGDCENLNKHLLFLALLEHHQYALARKWIYNVLRKKNCWNWKFTSTAYETKIKNLRWVLLNTTRVLLWIYRYSVIRYWSHYILIGYYFGDKRKALSLYELIWLSVPKMSCNEWCYAKQSLL